MTMEATFESVSDTRFTPAFLAQSRYARSGRGWLTDLGIAATLVVAVMAFLSRGVTRDAEVLVFVTVLACAARVIRTDPRAWLYFVLLAFAVWMQIIDSFFHVAPEAADDPMSFLRNFAKMFFFMFPGWWLGGRERNARLLLVAGMIGVFARIFLTASVRDWGSLLTGSRADFGYINAEHTAVLVASVLIGLACFAPWFLRRDGRSPGLRLVLAAVWLVMVALSLAVLGATQTRQVWVGLGIAAIATVPFAVRELRRRGLLTRRRLVASGGAAAFVLAAFVVFNPLEGPVSRMERDWHGIHELLVEGQTPQQLNGSVIRLLQWRFAFQHIAERPILGHGGGATEVLLERSDLPRFIRLNFGHVHNSFLDLWMAYGVVAPAALILALVVLLVGVWRGYRRGQISTPMTLFGIAWIVFFAVVNCFESYFIYHTGYYMMFVCGGALYGATLEPRAGVQPARETLK